MNFTAGAHQVLGDLAAGLPGAHHQDGAVGQLLRVAVGVELVHMPGETGGPGLEGTAGQDKRSLPRSSRGGLHAELTARPGDSPGSGPSYVSPAA